MSEPDPLSVLPEERYTAALGVLGEIVHELIGVDVSVIDPRASFFEMGVDSLLLIQASQMIEARCGVAVSLFQLIEELSSLDKLAAFVAEEANDEHLEAARPAGPPPPVEPAPAASPPAAPSSALPVIAPTATDAAVISPSDGVPLPDGALAQVFAQQLQALSALAIQQLQLIRQAPPSSAGALPRSGRPTVETASAPAASPAALADGADALRPGSSAPSGRPPASPADAHRQETSAAWNGPRRQHADQPYDPYEPLRTGLESRLDERQERHLRELIERYTRRTQGSKRMAAEHRRFLADNRWSKDFRLAWKELIYPIASDRSQGSRLWDVDGNEYVDIAMGFGLHLFGHSPDFVTRAVSEQLERTLAAGPQNPTAGRAAELLAKLTGLDRAIFMSSGTEAVMAALRAARTFSGRDRIARFFGAYHGWSDATLVSNFSNPSRTLPGVPGVPAAAVAQTLVLGWDAESALETLEREIDTLGAVIVEPVQSRRPDIQPRRFLREVRRLTREHGVPLIFDEMITGFRIHLGGAQHHFGVAADLAIYGKVLAGGLPLGVVAGRAEFMDVFDGGAWDYGDESYPRVQKTLVTGAYFKNPLTMAVTLATLEELERRGPAMQEDLNARTARLVDRLNDLFRRERAPLEVVHFGSLFRFVESRELNKLFFFHLIDEGIFYNRDAGNCFLSTAHDDEDLERIYQGVARSIAAMQRGGYFPTPPGGAEPLREPRPPAVESAAATVSAASPAPATPPSLPPAAAAKIDFGLYFFGTYEREYRRDKYDLLVEAARFGDRHGFAGIWLPERHFNTIGGLSPRPSILAAALARETERLRLRAGSVVVPLHNPLHLAEDWALVDNLSGGRAEVAIASGWHPNDFVFAPDVYERRRQHMDEGLEVMRRLWRGEEVVLPNGKGEDYAFRLYPAPSRELPLWLTAANLPTYEKAGRLGVGLLTNLWNQSIDDLAVKLELYRRALAAHGHPAESARVAVLLHTFLDADAEQAIDVARGPLCDYFRSSLWLLESVLRSEGRTVDFDKLSRAEVDYLLNAAYDRWVAGSALIGSPESCRGVLDRLAAIGVTEVGCFIDFGLEPRRVLAGLEQLARLRRSYRSEPAGAGIPPSPAAVSQARRIPASETQRNFYVLWQLGPDAAAACNEPFQLDFDSVLDQRALAAALGALCRRHEALHLRYADGGETFVVERHAEPRLPHVDLRALSPQAAVLQADELCAAAARRPMDPRRAPLLHCLSFVFPGGRSRLLKVLHHGIVDDHSSEMILHELRQLYGSFCRGERLELPPPRPFDALLGARDTDALRRRVERNEAYWLEKLKGGVPVLDLPTDRPRPRVQPFHIERVAVDFDTELLARVRGFAGRTDNTVFVTLLSGVALLMHRLGGVDELVIGINAYQPDTDATPLLGNRVHPMVVLSRIAGMTTVGEYLKSLRRAVVEAYEHQEVSLPRVLKRLGERRDPSRLLPATVVFNLDRSRGKMEFGDLVAEVCSLPSGARAELTLNASERREGIHLFCDFISALFDPSTIVGWLQQLGALLTRISEGAETPVAELLTLPQVTLAGAAAAAAGAAPEPGARALSRYQSLLWAGQLLHAGKPIFNINSGCWVMRRPVDPELLQRAFDRLVAGSDALRTVIEGDAASPRQRVLPRIDSALEHVDLPHLDDPVAAAQAWADERCRRIFQLDRRLFDAAFLRLGDGRWAFYLNLCHVIADFAALGVAFGKLSELYELARDGRLDQAEDPPPFADFLDHERQVLAGRRAERAQRYWRDKLSREIDPPAFYGSVRGRRDTRVERHRLDLGPELSQRLVELARTPAFFVGSDDFSLPILCEALVAAWVHRLTGGRRLALGMPVHNRPTKAFQETIGLFMMILPQHLQLAPETRLSELAAQARKELLETLRFRELPVGNPSRRPAYEIEFNFLDFTMPAFAGEAPEAALWPHPRHGAESLAVQVAWRPEERRLELNFDFHEDVFTPAERERAIAHFRQLAAQAAEKGDVRLRELDLLDAEERRQLLVDWNRTDRTLPPGSFAARFAEQVDAAPDRVAVSDGARTLTYAGLAARAACLARGLAARGAGPGSLVAVRMERGADLVTAILATFELGAAYLPLDPHAPESRLAQTLLLSRATPVLVDRQLGAPLDAIRAERRRRHRRAFRLTSFDDALRAGRDAPTRERAGGDAHDLAYVIFTSGSTGAPKGAMVEQLGMLNHLWLKIWDLELDARDAVAQTASQCFDISVWQSLAALLVGGRVAVAGPEIVHDPVALCDWMEGQRVSVVELVPSMLRAVLDELGLRRPRPTFLALRWMIATGEALPPELCRAWLESYPAIPMLNAYGPTECSDDVTHEVIRRPPGAGDPRMPIGPAVANLSLYVLDGLDPTPRGVPGELAVGGIAVGRGYLRDPRRTAEVFVPDPFRADGDGAAAGRLYRTGDLVRYLDDGRLDFLGRIDHQLKIRGFRIEPGEIEAALDAHPAVRASVVLPRREEADTFLVAYFVPADDAAPTPEIGDLRAFLLARLPDYMVPSAFQALDAFPLTPNGKLDRKALPAVSRSAVSGASEAARGRKEEILARVWQDVLGIDRVGRNDDFFALGGDSLLSIRIVSKAGQEGLRLTPMQVFQHPTIAGLAAAAEVRSVDAGQRAATGDTPLTPIQHWFFALDVLRRHHWNQAILLETRLELPLPRLAAALDRLLEHHDALRARFTRGPDGWRQRLAAPGEADAEPPCLRIDLSRLVDGQAETWTGVLEAAGTQVQASLDLAHGPMLRAALFHLGSGEGDRLLFAAHHLVIDALSWGILFEDLQTLLQAADGGPPPELPLRTTSIRAWSERLVEHAASPELAAELELWRSMARTAASRPLPRDLDGEAGRDTTDNYVFLYEVDETRRLSRDLPDGMRLDVVLLATLVRTLCEWSGSPDLVVELESHGRADRFPDLDLSRTVGWFTSIYPVRLAWPNRALPEEARDVAEQLARIPDQGVGFGVLRHLSPDPELREELGRLQRAEVGFNYLGQIGQVVPSQAPFRLAAERGGQTNSGLGTRPHLLEVTAMIRDGRLRVGWNYSTAVHRRETILELGGRQREVLRELLAGLGQVEEPDPEPAAVGEPAAAAALGGDFNWDQGQLDEIFDALKKRGV